MRNKILLVALFCLVLPYIAGCSAERRIARIAARHGYVQTATMTIRDTIAVPEIDTVYIVPLSPSGVFSMHDKTNRIKVSGMTDGDSVILCVRRFTDTVIVEKTIPYEKIVVRTKEKNGGRAVAVWALMLWLAGFFLAVIVQLDKHFSKK